jgi:hypothetical protein
MDVFGENLQLYGMKAAFDEIMTTAIHTGAYGPLLNHSKENLRCALLFGKHKQMVTNFPEPFRAPSWWRV